MKTIKITAVKIKSMLRVFTKTLAIFIAFDFAGTNARYSLGIPDCYCSGKCYSWWSWKIKAFVK